jgi:hypothetical protein
MKQYSADKEQKTGEENGGRHHSSFSIDHETYLK